MVHFDIKRMFNMHVFMIDILIGVNNQSGLNHDLHYACYLCISTLYVCLFFSFNIFPFV